MYTSVYQIYFRYRLPRDPGCILARKFTHLRLAPKSPGLWVKNSLYGVLQPGLGPIVTFFSSPSPKAEKNREGGSDVPPKAENG